MKINHIAFIMDGNGRWAKKINKSRKYGHEKGVNIINKIIKILREKDIKYATFFAFSTENWKRPKDEVDYIFYLLKKYLTEYLENNKYDYILNIIGDIEPLDNEIKDLIYRLPKIQNDNHKSIITIAINYGSRSEILQAVNSILKEKKESITQEEFEKYLYTKDLPNPDILVRTSGEKRISNFLLYQIAYSELFFLKKCWPQINKKDIEKIIESYNCRNRSFGGLNA